MDYLTRPTGTDLTSRMVTLMKTMDVTPLVRLSRKRGYKFNMLLCWCIGKTAEFLKRLQRGIQNFERSSWL